MIPKVATAIADYQKEHVPSTDKELKDLYRDTTYDPYKEGVYDKNKHVNNRNNTDNNSTDSQNNSSYANNNSSNTHNPSNQTPTEFVMEKSELEMPHTTNNVLLFYGFS